MDEKKITKHVTDLGAAAYLLMNGFKVKDKRGQAVYFEFYESEADDFERVELEYYPSEFHRFDSCLMSLKKFRSRSQPHDNRSHDNRSQES
jgi:hypothetical protein